MALFEGSLIAGHRYLAGEGPPRGPLDVLSDVAVVAGIHLAAWLVVGLVLLRLTRDPLWLFRGVVTVAAAGAFAARLILADEVGAGAHPLLLVVLLGLWLTPRSWWERLRPFYRTTLAAAAVLTVSLYSLWGRAPDFRHDLGTIGWLFLGSAVGAIVLTLALFTWPRVAGATLVVALAAVLLWDRLDRSVPEDQPSVLFVLVDTARRDHVRPFDDLVDTPAVEALATRGVLFSDAVTVIPKTSQSVASFLTAR